uniref:Macaca fascicularis brain cDNA clone: QflA-21292, similar to human splicing factor, arginine/serine-rich 7, 35kDa (SFRS7), mRNA, RefSeq: NM_006276.36 n=1 Tax=Macaca fascicularis TaxID=9541 RepID=I7GKJ2_MACFA|nr:unnamed protein product [Macaca fascicularis]
MIFILIAAFRLLLGGIVSIRTPQHRGNSTQWSFVSLLSTLVITSFIPKKCMFEELSEIGTKHHVNQLCKIFQSRYYPCIQMDCLILSKDLVIFKLGFAVPNHQHSSILPGWCKVIKDVNQKCQ